MKAKNEHEFTTIRVKKSTAKSLKKICARKFISNNEIVHPYEVIEDLLKPSKPELV